MVLWVGLLHTCDIDCGIYVKRKMPILWNMIRSRTSGTGAYLFSTKCHGSLLVIKEKAYRIRSQ